MCTQGCWPDPSPELPPPATSALLRSTVAVAAGYTRLLFACHSNVHYSSTCSPRGRETEKGASYTRG